MVNELGTSITHKVLGNTEVVKDMLDDELCSAKGGWEFGQWNGFLTSLPYQ